MARHLHLAAAVDRDVAKAVDREQDRLGGVVEGVRTRFDAVKLLRDVELRYARHREVTRRPPG